MVRKKTLGALYEPGDTNKFKAVIHPAITPIMPSSLIDIDIAPAQTLEELGLNVARYRCVMGREHDAVGSSHNQGDAAVLNRPQTHLLRRHRV